MADKNKVPHASRIEQMYNHIAHDLAWESSKFGQRLRLEVISRSMSPLLKPGDKVIVQKSTPDSLRIGDIVVVRRKGEFVTHRLVRKGSVEWFTKGDSCRYLDPPISSDAILGQVISIEREDKNISFQSFVWRVLNRCLGYLSWWETIIFRFVRAIKTRLSAIR